MAKSCRGWYWGLGLASFVAMGGAIASSGDYAHAQVTPDVTLGAESSVVTLTNVNGLPSEQIDGGAARGANLFHSFDEFSIPALGEASFNNTPEIQNIISRVTGSSISNIDGLIRANGTANLFLLNPNGIVFGPNATLSIGGSFVGSTASSLNFADGTQFSATAPTTTPLLTVSVPFGLQYGANPGRIQVQGNGEGLRSFDDPIVDTTSGLRVRPNQTLAIVGGDVALLGGTLKTAGGRIELGSVAGAGRVNLTPIDSGWALGYQGVPTFGDIQLSGAATVDTSGAGGGDVRVQGRQVTLTNGSQIEASTLGAEPGGTLTVTALESVELIGRSADGQFVTALAASVYPRATGNGGNLTVETGRLTVQGGAQVLTVTYGTGAGGTLSVTASNVVEAIGTTANDQFPSGLFASTQGEGNAGDLTIATGRLSVQGGAQVSASTRGSGAGGTLNVTASDVVEVIGRSANGQIGSGLFAQVNRGAEGNAGNLTIATGRLSVQGGAQVSARTFGIGAGGTLSVTASDLVELIGTSDDGRVSSGLFASTQDDGNAGDLTIATGRLSVQGGAQVTVRSQGSGNAGSLRVAAGSLLLENFGGLLASTASGEGGNIDLQVQDSILMRRNSLISAQAGGTGNGGNITINAPFIVAVPSENSDIFANAIQGRGGNIEITTQGLYGLEYRSDLTSESDINASSEFGVSGTVEINTPDVDPTQGLVELPAELVDASNQIATGCAAAGENEFIITGRSGLPPNPYQPLDSSEVWRDVQLPRELASNSTGVSRTSTSPTMTLSTKEPKRRRPSTDHSTTPIDIPTHGRLRLGKFLVPPGDIVEATGWIANGNGNVELVAKRPTAISQERCGWR